MKTLFVFLLVLSLVTAVIVLDFRRLDVDGWLSALAVAALFAVALNDRVPGRRPPTPDPLGGARPIRVVRRAEQKVCVLCPSASS